LQAQDETFPALPTLTALSLKIMRLRSVTVMHSLALGTLLLLLILLPHRRRHRLPIRRSGSSSSIRITLHLQLNRQIRHSGIHIGAVLAGDALPKLLLVPCTVQLPTEVVDGLLRDELLERPLVDVLVAVVLQFLDVRNGAREDRAFVLLTARDDLGEFVDAFVYCLAAATFDFSFWVIG